MKIEMSWRENAKMLVLLVLFFGITGGIRWYTSLDDAEQQVVQESEAVQTGDYIFTDEDFELSTTTNEFQITDEDF